MVEHLAPLGENMFSYAAAVWAAVCTETSCVMSELMEKLNMQLPPAMWLMSSSRELVGKQLWADCGDLLMETCWGMEQNKENMKKKTMNDEHKQQQ